LLYWADKILNIFFKNRSPEESRNHLIQGWKHKWIFISQSLLSRSYQLNNQPFHDHVKLVSLDPLTKI